jgi:hypothetical protein
VSGGTGVDVSGIATCVGLAVASGWTATAEAFNVGVATTDRPE